MLRKKFLFTLIQLTPILLPESEERKIVEENNWEVSYDGMELHYEKHCIENK